MLASDGQYNLEKGDNGGDVGDFWKEGMTLGPGNGRVFPNTDAYQNGSVRVTGVTITDIKKVDTLMTFRVSGLSKTETALPLTVLTEAPTESESILTDDLTDTSEGLEIGNDENNTDSILEPFQDGLDFAQPTENSIQSSASTFSFGPFTIRIIVVFGISLAAMKFLP